MIVLKKIGKSILKGLLYTVNVVLLIIEVSLKGVLKLVNLAQDAIGKSIDKV